MSVEEIKKLMRLPADTVVLCTTKIKSTSSKDGDPTSSDAKTKDLDGYDMYAGDVIPGKQSEQYPKFAQISDPYSYRCRHDKPHPFVPFYTQPKNAAIIKLSRKLFNYPNKPQILRIKPPIPCNFNNNYFPVLVADIRAIYTTMLNNHSLTKDLVYAILHYLPFTFPIFISCSTIFRGRLCSWTHFTYPFTKNKGEILNYMKECEKVFDCLEDCPYLAEFYVMKDDVPMVYKSNYDDVADHKNVCIAYRYNVDTLQRVYNPTKLICRDKANKLQEIMRMNDVGGSSWLSIVCNKEKQAEWFEDTINDLDRDSSIVADIGGSCGIKSRCWYQLYENQLDEKLKGKYLPMSVVSVLCGSSLLRQIIDELI